MTLYEEAVKLLPQISKDRRQFHMHPELAFEEVETAKTVAARLTELGYEVNTGIGKTGVVALLEGEPSAPVIMLRFDMDALPMQEANETDYCSQLEGKMHACGHDAHTASGMAVAALLMKHRAEFPATFKLVFQPAEELALGAPAMIADGVLKDPRPDYALGMHVWNDAPLGWVSLTSGPVMAGCDDLHITITGKGGHGGVPNRVKDPIVAAANVIMSLQTVVSRNLSPFDNAVLSIGSIQGGTASNIIPPEVVMHGTLRSYSDEAREVVLNRAREIVEGVSAAMGCQGKFEAFGNVPPTSNDPEVIKLALEASKALGTNLKIEQNYRTAGSEDMSYFLREIPGAFFFIGSANAAEGKDFAHHHPRFDIDENALPIGVALMLETAKLLSKKGV